MKLGATPIKGDFVTEIPRFCDIIHIRCRYARQRVDNMPVCPRLVILVTGRRTAVRPLASR
jgi:hypothetical protein